MSAPEPTAVNPACTCGSVFRCTVKGHEREPLAAIIGRNMVLRKSPDEIEQAVVAAIRAMTPTEQAELIGGGVREVVNIDYADVPRQAVANEPANVLRELRRAIVPCQRTDEHEPHRGCVYQPIDADVTRDHEEDER